MRRISVIITVFLVALLSLEACANNMTSQAPESVSYTFENYRLTTDSHKDEDPFLMQDSGGVYWGVWCSDRSGNGDIWCSNSPDGVSWADPIQLTSDNFDDWYPSLVQDPSGTYWLAWMSWRSGNYDVWYANSQDGKEWSEPVQLTTDESLDWVPSLSIDSSGAYWVTWVSERSGNKDIWYSTSKDGDNWSEATQLTTDPAEDDGPWLLRDSNGTYWVVWHSNRNGNSDIFYSNSTDGANWSEPAALIVDKGTDIYPFMLQDSHGRYWATWTTDRSDMWGDIWYCTSQDGQEWSAPNQLTEMDGKDYTSRLMEDSSGIVWVTWVSERSENLDVWFGKMMIETES